MADAPPEVPPDPGLRGSLTIRSRAAGRIVERAALDVDGVIRHSSRFGSITGRDAPRAIVDMTIEQPNVRVDIAVEWPVPVARVCVEVRDRVVERMQYLTGTNPSRVDVSVCEVVPAEPVEDESAAVQA